MGIKHSTSKTSGDRGYATDWNADHVIDNDVDFDHNEAQNFVIENRTTWPAAPVEGQIIWRSDTNEFWVWDGTSWQLVWGVVPGLPVRVWGLL